MRRLVLLVAGLLAAITLTAPAQADTQVQKCWKYDDGVQSVAYICAAVNFTRDSDGTGGTLTAVRIWATGDMSVFESKVEACDNLRLWNSTNDVRWRRDNAECDLTKSTPSRTWFPNVGFHASPTMNLGWTFYPKINNGPDPGYTHISIAVAF